jgi:hypothetical protein
VGRFTEWVGKKLEERREKNQLEQEERERIQEENKKHRFEIQDLLDKFTIKQLQEFCSSYIGTLPEDELEVDEDDDEKETIRPEKKKTGFKFGKRKLSWKKDPATRRRREYTEFIWNCIEEGDIRYQQLKDFSLNNRIVSPSFFGTETKAIGSDSELHTILDAIEEDFDPEKIMDEPELQGQIAVFLKTRFKGKDVKREVPMQEGSSDRNYVDIVIDNVYALEVKLPTTRTQLRNLKGQLEEYQESYSFLGVVIGDKTKLVTDSSDTEFYDSKFEPNLPVWIKEYTDKYKVDLGIRSVVFNIVKRRENKNKKKK